MESAWYLKDGAGIAQWRWRWGVINVRNRGEFEMSTVEMEMLWSSLGALSLNREERRRRNGSEEIIRRAEGGLYLYDEHSLFFVLLFSF